MIRLAPEAVEDLGRLRAFLDDRNRGAAKRAILAILVAIERLEAFPELGRIIDDPIRQVVVRFGASNYIVRYAIEPAANDILITRVWHSREDRPLYE